MSQSRSIASNAFLAAFVLAIAVMLLVPLPTAALDFLLALNISFAFLLLLVGLYMPNALALLSFPSILLLSTLFRLSLNVASTRLILAQGEAGRVIEAFGTFLIRGEIIVGVIIFTIITVVNFIVIARGASRVSEVTARFALDALPGKQMAIDADLRSGVINVQQAEERRETLRMESQLYGSMDGAMKFVQGDAIAGFFIIFANVLGGLYLGVQNGLSFAEAIQTYVTLTIGDGLVSQVPALLISICAGIVVTRVSSGRNTTLGFDLSRQLFTNPILLSVTAVVVLCIGLLPGMPTLPFLLIAVLFICLALYQWRGGTLRSATSFSETGLQAFDSYGATEMPLLDGETQPSQVLSLKQATHESQIRIELDSTALFSEYAAGETYFHERWQQLLRDVYNKTGLELPFVSVVPHSELPRGGFQISVSSSIAFRGHVEPDQLMVEVSPVSAATLGFQLLRVEPHPLNGAEVIWVPASVDQKQICVAAEIPILESIDYIFLRTAVHLVRHPEEVLGITNVHSLMKQMEADFPGLMQDSFGGNYLTVARLTDILQELCREGVSIKNSKQILEAIASYCSLYSASMVESNDFDLQDVLSYVRTYRKRVVTAGLLSHRGILRLATLSSQVEGLLRDARFDVQSRMVSVGVDNFERLREGLDTLITPIRKRGILPVALLIDPAIRHKVSALLRSVDESIRVVTYDELDPGIRIESVGVWHLHSR